MTSVPSSARRGLGATLLLAALLTAAGCQNGTTGSVSGKVTHKGTPVTTGTLNFFAPDKGVGADAKLGSGGEFTFATPLPAGKYKVYIQPPLPEQLPPGSKPKKQEKLNVPLKYQDASKSDLYREVKPGKNEFPIDLTD